MSAIRFGVWNVEWLNDLFIQTPDGATIFKPDDANARGPGRRSTVGARKEILAKALEALDLDLLVVVEGPNRTEELQLFCDEVAPGDWRAWAQPSVGPARPGGRNMGASQCLGLMARTDRGKFFDPPFRVFDAMDPASGLIYEASQPFHADSQSDGVMEWYRFERKPVYAEIRLADGDRFRVLGLHLKSKGIFTAYEWSRWWAMADANRARLLAQCRRIRRAFLDAYMTDPETRDIPLIVAGDINDGPGFDASEERLQASGVETLMGDVWRPDLTLGNALFDTLSPERQGERNFQEFSTTRFADPIFNDTRHSVWIDHILYTPSARPWVQDGAILKRMPDGTPYYRASDHYPVVAILQPPSSA